MLEERKKEQTRLLTELDQYKLCDPQVIKQLKQETSTAIDATNRWTGTLYIINYCTKCTTIQVMGTISSVGVLVTSNGKYCIISKLS